MSARRPRSLRPDEKELWEKVKQSTVPLHRPGKEVLIKAIEKIAPTKPVMDIPAFQIGQYGRQATLPTANVAPLAVRMDAKKLGRIKKGKLAPQARIDLHGMTLAQAHPALLGFILKAHAQGVRLVLVITGKGRPAGDRDLVPLQTGVLKRQVPGWLSQAPLGTVVQQVVDAHARHGGGGALYVYLRRRQ